MQRQLGASAEPVSAEIFARLLARLGPFEPKPVVAVAVSGGPDSMALALLLDEWAATRAARIEAITIDHGLRAESADEARQVGLWLAHRRSTRHTILHWSGPKPSAGLQAAAREARYRLLTDHCRAQGILHLCIAHQLDDQVETRTMRAARNSGPYGLAGMSAVRCREGVRLLRPLLGVTKAGLVATLTARGQGWIEDPSNRNAAFERVRLRQDGAADPTAMLPLLHRAGLERQRLNDGAAALLVESLRIEPEGWATIAGEALATAGPSALRAFSSLLQTIGGTEYPVSPDRGTEALELIGRDRWSEFTLGGCHLARRGDRLQICRDWGAIQDRQPARPGGRIAWDRRFQLRIPANLPEIGAVTIARLGEQGVAWLGRAGVPLTRAGGGRIPESARKSLPALWRGEEPIAVPHLGFGQAIETRFKPAQSATSSGFTVAY